MAEGTELCTLYLHRGQGKSGNKITHSLTCDVERLREIDLVDAWPGLCGRMQFHNACTIHKRLAKKELVVDTQVNLVAWTQHGTYAAFAANDTKGNGFKERFLPVMANKVCTTILPCAYMLCNFGTICSDTILTLAFALQPPSDWKTLKANLRKTSEGQVVTPVEVVCVIRVLCKIEFMAKGKVVILLDDEASDAYGAFFDSMEAQMQVFCKRGQEHMHGT